MNKRALSFLMCGALTLSLATPALAVEDLSGHWAKDALETWQSYGVLRGDENGNIRPNSSITRGELAVILDRVMEYQVKAANRFTDLNSSWYTDAILGAAAAGILVGYEDGTVKPGAAITRQEAALMFARVLDLDTQGAPSAGYQDQSSIGFWAVGAVNAMTAAGYLQGSGNLFRPQDSITRAEVITILDNIFASNYNESGEYTGDVDGSAVINADRVVLKDMHIAGDVIVAEGVADGHVELDNVTVGGRLIVRGGGENSIVLKGSTKVGNMVVARQDSQVRVSVEGSASVSALVVQDGSEAVKIDGRVPTVHVEGAGAVVEITGSVDNVVMAKTATASVLTVAESASVGVVTTAAVDASVSVSGKVESVTVTGSATDVTVAAGATVGTVTTQAAGTNLAVSGKVENVSVTETASGTTVTTQSGAKVDSVTTAGTNTTVSGEGTVSKVEAAPGASGTTVTTGGTKVENNSSESVTTGNGTVDAGSSRTTASTGAGSNGGGSNGGSDNGGVIVPPENPSESGKTALKNAVDKAGSYQYDDEFAYTGTFSTAADGDVVTVRSEYKPAELSGGVAAMNDMARFLGALYRQDNGTVVKSITYLGETYTWANGENAVNLGSNWVKDADAEATDPNTLVSALVDEFQSSQSLSPMTLNGDKDASITLKLEVCALVSNESELNGALAAGLNAIKLSESFTASAQIELNRAVTLDGNGKTITSTNAAEHAGNSAGILVSASGVTIRNLTVSGPNNTPASWDSGEYGIKVYNTDGVVLENVTVTAANAGIQATSSTVTLRGSIDVSGNEFGGIEVCKASDKETPGKLVLDGATLVCANVDGTPAIWIDGTTADQGSVEGADHLTRIEMGGQVYFYVDAPSQVTRGGLTLSFEGEAFASLAEGLYETESGAVSGFEKPESADLRVSLQAASGVSKNVRITVTDVKKDGGDTQAIQVIAVDTDAKAWNILESGWGPLGGFPAPTDKTTTECYITATEAGTYTAMVNVVDASGSDVLVSLPISIVVQ